MSKGRSNRRNKCKGKTTQKSKLPTPDPQIFPLARVASDWQGKKRQAPTKHPRKQHPDLKARRLSDASRKTPHQKEAPQQPSAEDRPFLLMLLELRWWFPVWNNPTAPPPTSAASPKRMVLQGGQGAKLSKSNGLV